MKLRRRILPYGWYPTDREQTLAQFNRWGKREDTEKRAGSAAVVPHAGWSFSGELAYRTLARLDPSADTVAVVGGHLPAEGGVFAVSEDGFETPLGIIETDKELLEDLRTDMTLQEDVYADNTVEIQLPLVKYLFPDAKAVSLRVPPSSRAIELGDALFEAARKEKKTIVVIGSTDLTHYGPNYGFSPKGTGRGAVRWVEEENDKRIIDAILDENPAEIITRGTEDRSACSAGAAAAAVQYAKKRGIVEGELVNYFTSYSIHPSDSFVGYAGIFFG